jgi:hypothetical protein
MGTHTTFKSIAVIASAAVIMGAFIAPADAKTKRRERTAQATYYGPMTALCSPSEGLGCARFPSTSKEKYVSIEITDTLPTTVYARVLQRLNGTQMTEVASICGRSEEPIRITPGADVYVWIWGERGLDLIPVGCPGAPSSGTIKITFSNLP